MAEVCDAIMPVTQLAQFKDLLVSGLALDSRKVCTGDLFLAVSGQQFDGRRFIDNAIERGAVAVLYEGGAAKPVSKNNMLPIIEVTNLSALISRIAANFYARPIAAKVGDIPTKNMTVVGVTGTNGKTTSACLIADLASQLLGSVGSGNVGLIGTLGSGIVSREAANQTLTKTGYTTPDAIQTQRYLYDFTEASCEVAVMEVSSHALDQHRVASVPFNIAVFTNLSRDHLDYHGNMKAYAQAKQALFEISSLRAAVINIDDECGRKINSQLAASVLPITYSVRNTAADVYAHDVVYQLSGFRASIVAGQQVGVLHAALIGEFNLSNALAAIAVLLQMGQPLTKILLAFEGLKAISGRVQLVGLGASKAASKSTANADISVVVDFAHTPDALEKVLVALRAHTDGALWCVFGCGGDRDKGKRKLMGEIASRLADQVVITADNPRSETAQSIAEDIRSGIQNAQNIYVEHDRATAIAWAIEQSGVGDLVLVAGKGHETQQIIADRELAFSDYDTAQNCLQQRCSA